ncbi:MAG: UDP-N-acetylmuramoyl-tripeptide--D-alanyl-D-alanine ligase [Zetaproteobacteria bacterium]|nr:UDP-N-acetylmuramoyl-tripeptide--D-alanyl-D-alanine ligase [Zetaproteobacteria bacterium]
MIKNAASFSANEVTLATGGRWLKGSPARIEALTTNSREASPASTFIALRGERFDGHQFAHGLEGKISALIGDHRGIQSWQQLNTPMLEVENTLIAYGDLAHAWREKLRHCKVIALTGSYGKTTIRSMLEHVLRQHGLRVHATQANLNNRIGVPMTLLATPEDCQVALIECGISEAGEMDHLAKIVTPDIAILTGVTAAHSQGLGTLHAIAQEKAKLLTTAASSINYLGYGVAPLLDQAMQRRCISMDDNHGVQWQRCDKTLHLHYLGQQAEITLSLPADHWCANMALVATILIEQFQFTLIKVADALQHWRAVAGRMQAINGIHGSHILNDCYNANPASMQSALDTLGNLAGERIAILGDMAELGDSSEGAHATLQLPPLHQLLLVGPQMQHLHQQQPHALWFENSAAVCSWMQEHPTWPHPNHTVLIKASHSMNFDTIVQQLTLPRSPHAL